jgi:hypothetical protein
VGTVKNLKVSIQCRKKNLQDKKSSCAKVNEHETATLTCPKGKKIKKIFFASYGTPTGDCHKLKKGSCDSESSLCILMTKCLEKPSCSVAAKNEVFGDPCGGTFKRLLVEYVCG